jgi:hypothetical protein
MSNAAEVTPSNEDERWKQLAKQIESERDPIKVIELAQQLILEFDRCRPKAQGQRLAS